MATKKSVALVQDTIRNALAAVFGDWPIRVIIAKDKDIHVEVTDTDVRVWASSDKKGTLAELNIGQHFHLEIVGWPVATAKGTMVPIKWQGTTGWVDARWFKQEGEVGG